MSHGVDSGLTDLDQVSVNSNDYITAEETNETDILRDVVQVISNKFPFHSQTGGKEYDYTIDENGKIFVKNGVQDVDFIVDLSGKLHIGKKHSFMANKADVQAAGRMKIAGGKIRMITNLSGHYRPSADEVSHYAEVFSKMGIDISDTYLEVRKMIVNPNGYVSLGSYEYRGKVKNYRRNHS